MAFLEPTLAPVIHRDIDPANLHHNGDGVLRLFDPAVAPSGREPEAKISIEQGASPKTTVEVSYELNSKSSTWPCRLFGRAALRFEFCVWQEPA